ncbi:class B sortase [Agathobacter ruminis]|uniref:SrtB family sortase n=1 Tax=Agathobacter ruminis TaxID=1712665 RepID=A0A2G3E3I9_9FIRM|nr:class B sortase [Agathobacter ruminis]MDC7300787.1 class B sortase [Agathobacter ruminis]PHU37847.1 SrtB family sortase [Agathobacter ruminis]
MEEKKKRKKFSWSILLILLGIIIIGVAAVQLIMIYLDYHKSNELYDNLESNYTTEYYQVKENVDSEKPLEWYEMIDVDFDGLREKNSDVSAWIFFENEEISYPILFSGDDEYYLRRALDRSHATAGSLFLEGMNKPDFSDYHSIIYGHNMRNLSMFGKLKYYHDDEKYYPDHMYFQICTKEMKYRYQIFAYETVDAYDKLYTVPFGPTDDYQEFIQHILDISERDTGLTPTKDDRIVTLSTCNDSVSGDDERFVVHGYLIDSYEAKK